MVVILLMSVLFLLSVGAAVALGEEAADQTATSFLPAGINSAADLAPLIASSELVDLEPHTDPAVAEELPHTDLDRVQAEDLLEGVFGADQVEAPAEFFDQLDIEAFRSDHAALVAPQETGVDPGLLFSTLPLRTANESGEEVPVDLDLVPSEGGGLEPENPLVQVQIPAQLAEGISLPEAGVSVELNESAVDRSASQLGDASVFYPNVATDTDLVVAAAPTGFETYTHLRSPAAPTQQQFDLDVPEGAELRETYLGGAEVIRTDGSVALSVSAPSAIDAQGAQIPARLAVNGHSLILTTYPEDDTAYPILIDPIFDTFNFSSSTGPGTSGNAWVGSYSGKQVGYGWGTPNYGMNARAIVGPTTPGSNAWFQYYVPRYWADPQAGLDLPHSYIREIKLWSVTFGMPNEEGLANEYRPAYPSMQVGLWSPVKNEFAAWGEHYGYQGPPPVGSVYELKNPSEMTDVKNGGFGIATWASYNTVNRYVNVQQASVELTDQDIPVVEGIGSVGQWVNGQAAGIINYKTTDHGLGVHRLRVRFPAASGGKGETITPIGCSGVASSACPRTATQSTKAIVYSPALMSQGQSTLEVASVDPVDHSSEVINTPIKVDHTAPAVSLSGNLTEQASAGTNLREYAINYTAKDGDEAAAAALSPFGTAGTGQGQLERPFGVAVADDGSFYVVDRISNRVVKYDKDGKFATQFGSTGSADGQFNDPRGIALAPDGTVYVADLGNDRIQAFSPTGTFLRKVKFTDPASQPYAIAVAPNGSIWVTDIGIPRVVGFKDNPVTNLGALYGKQSNPNDGGTDLASPVGVTVDKYNNVWVADNGIDKVLEFDSNRKWKFQFGAFGSGEGQFQGPLGIDIAPSGNLAVMERDTNRVEIFKPDGTFLRQFGSVGGASSQFSEAGGLSFGPDNSLLVADAGNKRVTRWSHADQDPQSGTAKVEIKVDGASVHTKAPGCATKNCAVSGSWTLDADDYAGGAHKVEVIATDAVGISQTKTIDIQTHGDHTDPTIALSGTMTQQASIGTTRPNYKLKAVATDPGPTEELKSGVATTVIKVDGATVDSSSPGCPAGGCSITREWTLNSESYSVGSHTVEVKATDAAGRVSTKTLTIDIARDTTPPNVSYTGAFYSAPSGWLEQKQVAYSALASDGGYGVTSVELKIDGAVVNSTSGTCAAGGCLKLFASGQTLDMAAYSGGAHPAEFIARDGAGNAVKRAWTINVDPSGVITASEATDTLEAVEATTGESPLDPDQDSNYEGDVPGLSLVEQEDGYEVSGSAVPTVIDTEVTDGAQLKVLPEGALANACEEETNSPEEEAELPEGTFDPEELEPAISQCPEEGQGDVSLQPIDVKPIGTDASATDNHLVEGAAAVAANTAKHVDTVTRPIYEGAMTFQAIRDAGAPGMFMWHVDIEPDQELKQVNDQQAIVYWKEGGPAFSVKAIAAHDAVGTSVSTSIEVVGPESIALTVHHKDQNYVYPVVAGVGWQGGFTTYQVVMPVATPEEEEEEPGSVEGVNGWERHVFVRMRSEGPPVAFSGNGCDNIGPDMQWCNFTSGKRYNFKECYYEGGDIVLPEPPARVQWVNDAIEHCKSKYGWRRLEAKLSIHGWYRTNTLIDQVWIEKGNLNCDKWGQDEPAKVDCEKRPKDWQRGVGQPGHIEVLGDFRFWPGTGPAYSQPPGGPGTSACVTVWGEIEFGSGTDSQETIVSPARQGDPCNWP